MDEMSLDLVRDILADVYEESGPKAASELLGVAWLELIADVAKHNLTEDEITGICLKLHEAFAQTLEIAVTKRKDFLVKNWEDN